MKIEVSASELRRVLKLLGGVMNRHTTVPILGGVLIETSPGKMSLTATDLDTELRIEIEAETESKGRLVLLHRTLLGLAEAADGVVTIETDAKRDEVVLSGQDIAARVRNILLPEDWPQMACPAGQATASWEMSQKDADRLFRLARHCISTEETRYYLNGVFLTTKPDAGTLRSVATDGHRMAVVDTEVSVPGPLVGIVPREAVATVLSLMGREANEPARFEIWTEGTPRTRLVMEGVELVAKMIDGTYPDYTRVVPADANGISISLDRAGLRRMSRAARMFGHYGRPCLAFDPATQKMRLKGLESDIVEMPAQISVEEGVPPAPFGFNLAYLLAQAEATPTFRLTQKDAGAPALIHGEDPDAFFVIMPMRA